MWYFPILHLVVVSPIRKEKKRNINNHLAILPSHDSTGHRDPSFFLWKRREPHMVTWKVKFVPTLNVLQGTYRVLLALWHLIDILCSPLTLHLALIQWHGPIWIGLVTFQKQFYWRLGHWSPCILWGYFFLLFLGFCFYSWFLVLLSSMLLLLGWQITLFLHFLSYLPLFLLQFLLLALL